jgi:hypothetical protein
MAGTTGLEPATSDVTGRRSNQLSYVPAEWVTSVTHQNITAQPCFANMGDSENYCYRYIHRGKPLEKLAFCARFDR